VTALGTICRPKSDSTKFHPFSKLCDGGTCLLDKKDGVKIPKNFKLSKNLSKKKFSHKGPCVEVDSSLEVNKHVHGTCLFA